MAVFDFASSKRASISSDSPFVSSMTWDEQLDPIQVRIGEFKISDCILSAGISDREARPVSRGLETEPPRFFLRRTPVPRADRILEFQFRRFILQQIEVEPERNWLSPLLKYNDAPIFICKPRWRR